MRQEGAQMVQANQQLTEQLQAVQTQLQGLNTGGQGNARLTASLQGLKGMPVYKHDGKTTWSAFLHERKRWIKVYSMQEHANEDFQKSCLLYSIKGKAGEMMEDLETEGQIDALSLEQLLDKLGELFQPPAESAIFKQAFEERKQGPREDMVEYMASKEALYRKAYAKTNRNFDILKTKTIRGVYNDRVKETLLNLKHNPSSKLNEFNDLRMAALFAVAAEREKMDAGIGGSTYDGLATVTIGSKIGGHTNTYGRDEAMDIQQFGQSKKKAMGACFGCGKNGHVKRDCPEGRKVKKRLVRNFPGKCHKCGRLGHKKKDCIANTDKDGKKFEKRNKVSQVQDGAEVEDVSSASDTDSEE